jgi:(R)-1-hydroxy-2-aminoethylphosphonate ammonia-lyase
MATSSRNTPKDSSAEGDVNLSGKRALWQHENVGAGARALLDDDARYFLHQSLSTPCLSAIKSAAGIWLEDVDGRRVMDFHGNSVHQLGHGHPRVVEAVKRALDELPFSPRRYTNEYAVRLAQKLAALAPGDLNRTLFAPGGAEAIGMALKLARLATGRHKTISMWDSFHGASIDAISIGGEALFRSGIGPLLPGTEHVQPCDPRHCHFGCGGTCNARCADYVEYVLEKEEDVAAVVIETVRSTDVQVPPPEYYKKIRAACQAHGALLILDEIPVCLGRTGSLFAFEPYGILPDMVVLGKGLGGGVFPMAALIAREDLNIAGDRALGHYTHEKSPVGCAAALAALEVIEEEKLLERSRSLGARALARLEKMKKKIPSIVDVRGIGLLLAVELKSAELAEDALYRCLSRGLSFKVGQGNVLVLAPPLVIEEEDLQRALEILEECLS